MVLYFDMDGTIADLYNVPNWLDKLHAEDPSPYNDAKVIHSELPHILRQLRNAGAHLGIISWTAKGGTDEYNRQVRKAKHAWINEHFPHVFEEFHVIKYGVSKSKAAKLDNATLIDDNIKVRTSWENSKACNAEMPTIDASDTQAMIDALTSLLETLMS